MPEKEINFSSWAEVYKWVQKERTAWGHWYDYTSAISNTEVKKGMNQQRGPIIQLFARSQKISIAKTDSEKKHNIRLAINEIEKINQANPIISYSTIGKEMIDALDHDPEFAIKEFGNNFIESGRKDKVVVDKGAESKSTLSGKLNIKNKRPSLKSTPPPLALPLVMNSANSIPSFSMDKPEGEDRLSIMHDVNALAKLIAYKDLQPPLSIGLFGKWGSGKSFFMEKIQEKIDELADYKTKNKKGMFCINVVHIKFNAWHYSDTNLWASLVNKIFAELHAYFSKADDNIYSIFENLEISKNRIKEKESELLVIKDKKEKIKTDLEIIEKQKERDQYSYHISINNITDIGKNILQRDDVKEEFDKVIKGAIDPSVLKKYEDVKKHYNELTSFFGLLKKFVSLWKSSHKFKFFFVISIILIIASFCLTPFIPVIKNYINEYVTLSIASFASWWLILKPLLKSLNNYSKPLKFVMDNWDKYEEQESKKKTEEQISLQKSIDQLTLDQDGKKKELDREEYKLEKLENKIKDIKSGKYLANFIESRNLSDDYHEYLGLITTVRNDFNELSKQLIENNANTNGDAEFKIDRIVLYIDDLDRCRSEIVIQVLEAVHLILAFELFVVVVGVDPRWLSESLSNQFINLNSNDTENNKASTSDYLEKIFQIPFKLKELETSSKRELIDSLFIDDLYEPREKKMGIDFNPSEFDIDDSQLNSTSTRLSSPPRIDIKEHERMRVTKEELEFIKDLSELIGDTPRTIKRFVNIYRIIRTHEEIPKYSNKSKIDYQIISVLLILSFKNPKELTSAKESLTDTINKMLLKKIDEKSRIEIDNFPQDKIKKYVNFVSRFTFKEFNMTEQV